MQIQSLNKYFKFTATIGSISILSLLSVLMMACPSADKKKAGGKFEYKLECQSDEAIVTKIITKTDKDKEKGPVILPKNMSCDDAEDLDEKAIKKLKRQGQWEIYFTKIDEVQSSGKYENGKREGEWINFYEGSRAKNKTTQYSDGKKNGPEITFFEDGQIKVEGQNNNHKKSGLWKYYNAIDANCISQGSFSNNKKSGAWEECKRSPQTKKWYIAFKGSYRQGLRDGSAVFMNKDGNVSREGNYRADTSEACKKDPPKSGVPPLAKPENCGKKEGSWKFYFSDGKLASKGNYKNNKKNGQWVEHYKSGQKLAEGPRLYTKKGFRNGQWTFYNKDGSIFGKFSFKGKEVFTTHAILYKNNVKLSEGGLAMGIIKYDPKKDIIPKPTLKSGGHWKFYENGKLVREGGMNLGNKHGAWKYYKNGRVESAGEMISNRKQGKWKYYKNGRLYKEGEYTAGKKSGKWRENKGGGWKTTCYMFGRARKCR